VPHRDRLPDDARDRHRQARVHRLPRWRRHGPGRAARRRAREAGGASAAAGLRRGQLREPRARVHDVAEGVGRLRPVRQPGRPARRRSDLRAVPRRGGAARADEHDDARRDALGGGALQQRRVPREAGVVRRELRPRRPARAPGDVAAADAGGDREEGGPPVPRAARALGDLAAGQRAARLRARRARARRNREPGPGRGSRPARGEAEQPRVRHAAADRPRLPRPAEDAAARSAAVPPGDERPARRVT
jgi:hypothetical protein